MQIELVLDNGNTFEVCKNDHIGMRAVYDKMTDVSWYESKDTRGALIHALNSGWVLYISRKGSEIMFRPDQIVAAKAIDEGKTTLLWRRAVKSNWH